MRTLFLIRHGIAAPRGSHRHDPDRPLTEAGVRRTAECARGFARVAHPQVILTSPMARTRQTAELFSQALKPEPEVELADELAPIRDRQAVVDLLNAGKAASGAAAGAIVGHEPDLSELAGWLLAGAPHRVHLDLKKAAACRIDFATAVERGGGTLIWLLPPKVLQMLGGGHPR